MSEKRSITESQNPPNLLTSSSSMATLPSMKSKMFATIMITPARDETIVRQPIRGQRR